MRTSCLAAAILVFSTGLGFSASFSVINAINTPFVVPLVQMSDENGAPLDRGSAVDGDGDLILLGSVSDSLGTTLSDPNADNWPVPDWSSFFALTGLGSNNATAGANLLTSVGDGGAPADGLFSIGVTLNDGDHPDLPASGSWIIARIYNDKTIQSSTHYTSVAIKTTNSLANTTLNQPGAAATIDLDAVRDANSPDPNPQAVWEGGVPFMTNVANPGFVPEPSTALLSLLGMALFLRRRR